ncbi:thymic stromal cotransporter protein-like isoform X1 [Anopheles funestus]|uniref:thymic stromal cotransporter protein-like isoform X1 n=1 Tax=Anopheles funestus TaxID=62324 RepID=UPI0020C67C45|nr:thymic stromal cotransporter protein-like isoform X1 [Anopheles funestus]
MESGDVSVMSHVGRIWSKVKHFITIEPVIVFYIFGVVSGTALKVFEYEKACVTKLGADLRVCEYFVELEDDDICSEPDDTNRTIAGVENFTEFRSLVCEAQQLSTNEVVFLNSYRSIIFGIIQVVVLLFAGSWSDRVGLRKPCILVPIAADIVAFSIYILSAIFMREIPLEVAGIVPNLIISLSGGVPLVITGIYSYLTVCTDEKDRTFRFACTAVVYATIPIVANFFSGHLFKYFGFIKLCVLCIVTDTIGLLYGLFILKEPADLEPTVDNQTKEGDEKLSKPTLRQLFDIGLVVDCVKVFLKKRDFNCRNILYLTVLAYFINYGALGDGESAAILAYVNFNWITNLGTWISYDLLTTMLGTLLAMGVLSKRFGVSDAMICVFSVCFSLVGKPIMAVAVATVKPYLYYVATSIDVFEGSKMIAIRSLVSKLVGQDEIGKMLSILGIVDSAQVAIYPTIYSTVYLESQSVFVGSVFLLSEAFLLVSLGIYIALYLMSRRSENDKNKAQSSAKQGIDNPAVDITAL